MKQILTVFRFTFMDAFRKKAFIISTIVMAVLVVGLCAAPAVISMFSQQGESTAPVEQEDIPSTPAEQGEPSARCYVIDEGGRIPGAVDALHAAFGGISFIPGRAEDTDDYRAEIGNDANLSMVIITAEGEVPSVEVTTRDFMSGISGDATADVLTQAYVTDMLSQRGFTAEDLAVARLRLSYSMQIAGSMNVSGYAVGILLTMLVFFAVYYYGYGVAMSVATEKTGRVMETLVVSAPPSRILLGKCLAMGALGLAQLGSMLILATVCYHLLIPEGFTLFGMPIDFTAFTPVSALLILVYFLLGYALYALMNAVCGASVSKIEDLNSAMMPVMMIAMVAFYFGYFAAASGSDGLLTKAAMYIPFSAPFVMPFRLLNSTVPPADLAISIGLMVLGVAVIGFLSVRVYEASVLHYGKKLRIRDAYRSAKHM